MNFTIGVQFVHLLSHWFHLLVHFYLLLFIHVVWKMTFSHYLLIIAINIICLHIRIEKTLVLEYKKVQILVLLEIFFAINSW